jgi:hypothetical protein
MLFLAILFVAAALIDDGRLAAIMVENRLPGRRFGCILCRG